MLGLFDFVPSEKKNKPSYEGTSKRSKSSTKGAFGKKRKYLISRSHYRKSLKINN